MARLEIPMKTRREMLEDFVAQDPNDSFSRYALALELEKEGRELEAAPQLQEVIARDPNYVAAYYQLGRLLARLGQVEDARAVYRRGLDAAAASNDQRTRSEIQEALDMLD
jgi:tetratricopeptide (TPR) repeat protein